MNEIYRITFIKSKSNEEMHFYHQNFDEVMSFVRFAINHFVDLYDNLSINIELIREKGEDKK